MDAETRARNVLRQAGHDVQDWTAGQVQVLLRLACALNEQRRVYVSRNMRPLVLVLAASLRAQ